MATLVTRSGSLITANRRDGHGLSMVTNDGQSWGNGWWSGGDDFADTMRGISYADIYETQPAVAAVVNKMVRTISTLPVKVYKRDKGSANRKQVHDMDLERLFRRPAPDRSATDLVQWITMPMFVHGNALLAKYRKGGPGSPPTELLGLDWRYLSAYAKQGGPIEYWVTTQTGEERWIAASEVIHFKWDTPTGPLGVSPLKQLGITVRLDDAAQRYQIASFRNGARPSGAVVLPKEARVSELDKEEMKANLKNMHEGVDKAFRVALLTGGVDWKPMSFSAAEAEVASTRVFNREEVCMVYDIKPDLLTGTTTGAGGGAVEGNKEFYRSTIRTQLTLIEQCIQAQLIDPEPTWADRYFVEFDMTEQLKGDPLAEAQAIAAEINAGTMTPNEGRARRNRAPDPSPYADHLYLPLNNLQPLPQDDAPIALPPPGTPPPSVVVKPNPVEEVDLVKKGSQE